MGSISGMVWGCIVLTACARGPRPTSDGLSLGLDQESVDEVTRERVAPGAWNEPGGLGVMVPQGWSGRRGAAGDELLLELVHQTSAIRFELYAFPEPGDGSLPDLESCRWEFVDRGAYRRVPVLAPATTATCVPEVPDGVLTQIWEGRVGVRRVQVRIGYPAGRIVEGREIVEPLLGDLSVRSESSSDP